MSVMLFDFSRPDSVALWNPINDGVMGGKSGCRLEYDPAGHAVFSGFVASVRCHPGDLGRKSIRGYLLEVRGDGKEYRMGLRSDDPFDKVTYQARFHPCTGRWTSCHLAVADFQPRWRGHPVPEAPPLQTDRVRQISLMIADRQEGPFTLLVRSLAAEWDGSCSG
jgi:NADH dehydrogenase [ubiquinone] 1 alpha subcomplex assembly factor 1